ncbi:MAG: 2-oxoacid:acceptor oxidoreductase subunit alpha [bacterium]
MEDKSFTIDDLSIVICGEAGQGVETSAEMIADVFKSCGYNTLVVKEYMSRIRGGSNSSEIRISNSKNLSFVERIDVLILLSKKCFDSISPRLSYKTIIIANKETLPEKAAEKYKNIMYLSELSADSKLYVNIEALGTVLSLVKEDFSSLELQIRKMFASKDDITIQKNIEAAKKGFSSLPNNDFTLNLNIVKNEDIKNEIFLSGGDAVSLGCIAGGCNFISAYPMSPGTGVLTFLANNQNNYRIIAEQVEDEISAINMAIGASYTGARAMVTTSGGGFALMTEGVSLSGMIETPIVIHIGQRPGPATGLPTRTAQEDLNLALYAGHGEFVRAIYTPGDLEECFYLSAKAFNLADKFQIPVFILTDQLILDSYQHTQPFNLDLVNIENHIIKTDENYKRYKLTDDGVSPRGIPGFGNGLVVVDSDEHGEDGHITEDLSIRVSMTDKRLKKLEQMRNESEPPLFYGSETYKILVVSFGSNKKVINEAMDILKREDMAFLHINQPCPLHLSVGEYLQKAEKVIVIENNATAQLSSLIQLETGFNIDHKLLKYNGMPFSLEGIMENLGEVNHESE